MHRGGLPFISGEIEVEMSHCRATWPLCILSGRPAVALQKTLDRGQRRVFDCAQGEAVFALRKRRKERGEGMQRAQRDRERGMETDAERQRGKEEEVGRE